MSALEDLHALVRAEGGPVERELADRARPRPARASTLLDGPRSAERGAAYAQVVEAIYEGFELHHGDGRLFEQPDGDLAVLLGDHMYALGIERLVALGDIPAVVELADTIAITSLAVARDDADLAQAAWEAGAAAVANGSDEAHESAKRLAIAGRDEAFDAMRTSARRGRTQR